jgi:hypothetical protein
VFLDQGQQFPADASPQFPGVAIADVLAPGLFPLLEKGAQRRAPDLQQRPNYVTPSGVNSAEAGEPGSAKDVSEDRFGLVIGGMGHGEFRYFPVGS